MIEHAIVIVLIVMPFVVPFVISVIEEVFKHLANSYLNSNKLNLIVNYDSNQKKASIKVCNLNPRQSANNVKVHFKFERPQNHSQVNYLIFETNVLNAGEPRQPVNFLNVSFEGISAYLIVTHDNKTEKIKGFSSLDVDFDKHATKDHKFTLTLTSDNSKKIIKTFNLKIGESDAELIEVYKLIQRNWQRLKSLKRLVAFPELEITKQRC